MLKEGIFFPAFKSLDGSIFKENLRQQYFFLKKLVNTCITKFYKCLPSKSRQPLKYPPMQRLLGLCRA